MLREVLTRSSDRHLTVALNDDQRQRLSRPGMSWQLRPPRRPPVLNTDLASAVVGEVRSLKAEARR